MPNGRSIVLERQPGADTAGNAGLEDQVDNHWGEFFKAAALSTFLAVGTELGAGSDTNSNDSAIIQALRHGASGLAESNRTTGSSPQPQHPAHSYRATWLSSSRYCQSRPDTCALPRIEDV